MQMTIDRIEGKFAVCQTDTLENIDVPLGILPDGVKEGDIIYQDKFGEYQLLVLATHNKREDLFNKQEDLFKK